MTAWSQPDNWLGGVPGAGDTAVFTDNMDYTLNGAHFTEPLSFTPNLDFSNSVTLDMDSSWSGNLEVDNDVTLSLTGPSVWQGREIEIDTGGSMVNTGTLTTTSITTPLNNVNPELIGTLTNMGTITFQGNGNFIGGTIDNQSGGLIDIQGVNSAGSYPFVFATINNSGTIRRSVNTGTAGIWILNNAGGGLIDVETGTLIPWVQNGLSTGGTFTVASGATLQYGTAGTFTGTYTGSGGGQFVLGSGQLNVGSGGATFNFPAGFFQWQTFGQIAASSGDLTNAGSITIVSSPTAISHTELNGTLDNTGTITIQGSGNFVGGTINNQTGALVDVQGADSAGNPFVFATINNSGTVRRSANNGAVGIRLLNNAPSGAIDVETGTLSPWVQQGSVNSGGTFTVASGATLQYNSGNQGSTFTGTYTGSGGGQFILASGQFIVGFGGASIDFPPDFFEWAAGAIDDSRGNLVNQGSMTLSGSAMTLFGNMVNDGTIDIVGSTNFSLQGTLNNSAGSLIDFQGDGSILSHTGLISNAGTIRKSSGTGTTAIGTQGEPFGTLEVDNTGTVEADSGTMTLFGPFGELSGTTLTAGTWNALHGATLNFPRGISITTNQAQITLDGSGASFPALASLSSSSGSLAFTGGASFTTAGDFSNTGSLTLGAGSTLSVQGRYSQSTSAALTIGIGGTPASGQFGQLSATGSAAFGGSVATALAAGFNPTSGASYTIASYSSQSGGSSIAFNGLSSGRFTFFQPVVGATSIVLNTTTSAADLAAQPFGAPTSATVGQTITINYQVNNGSTTGATGNWVDSFYLSTSQVLTSSAVLIGRVSHSGGVAANGQYSGTLIAPLPPVAPANDWVIEIADSQGLVPDLNRTNNTVASSNPILVSVPSIALGSSASGTIAERPRAALPGRGARRP